MVVGNKGGRNLFELVQFIGLTKSILKFFPFAQLVSDVFGIAQHTVAEHLTANFFESGAIRVSNHKTQPF